MPIENGMRCTARPVRSQATLSYVTMNTFLKGALAMLAHCLMAASASQALGQDLSAVNDTQPSSAKKAAAERLLQKKKFVLEGKAIDGGSYTIHFYPQEGEMKVYLSNNVCFPTTLSAKFSINEFDNVSVNVEGLSKQINCPALRINIDPVTGVAGEYTYYVATRRWSEHSSRFFLKNE
jgi:hypothetical protein